MDVWLNVAEKNSVAKEVARVLSGGGRGLRSIATGATYNPAYEFEMGGAGLPSARMIVTSVSGHLQCHDFGKKSANWAGYPIVNLFTDPITTFVKDKDKNLLRSLQTLAKRASTLVLWLDCDREGERICFEVIDVCCAANPRLRVRRAHFSALTERDLLKAVQGLRAPDKNLSDSVEVRQEMDLRIGAVFTRFQCLNFRHRFRNMPSMLSYGPCQLPCLTFVVEKFMQRQAFVPEKFYHAELRAAVQQQQQEQQGSARFTGSGAQPTSVVFRWDRGNIYDVAAATLTMELMLDSAAAAAAPSGGVARVVRVDHKTKSRWAPSPLATVEMQKLASRHLRISSERCMAVAEELYQGGFISYPRTETDMYSYTDDELLNLVRGIAGIPEVAEYADMLLRTEPSEADRANGAGGRGAYRRPRPGGHNDKAHPPIHPLKPLQGAGAHDDHRRLYMLIVRHFLASMSKEAVAAETQVSVEFGGERFSCAGHTVLELNWLAVFPFERWNSSATIPNFSLGDVFEPLEVTLHEGTTTAPALLTESALISAMDAHGIGTDATIATHIKTIQDRHYAVVENGVFRPTPLGVALVTAYERIGMEGLTRPQLRAQMELAMNDVAQGRALKQSVLAAAIDQYRQFYEKACEAWRAMAHHMCEFLEPMGNAGTAAVTAAAPSMSSPHAYDATTTTTNTGGSSTGDLFDGAGGGGFLAAPLPTPGELLSAGGALVPQLSCCGGCGERMALVAGPPTPAPSHHGSDRPPPQPRFYLLCARCQRVLRAPSRHVNARPDGFRCPHCRFEVVVVTNPETGRTHTACPMCFTHPPRELLQPPQDIENVSGGIGGGFRCFMCCHPTCALAAGLLTTPLGNCPVCGTTDALTLRRLSPANSAGGTRYIVGCKAYPTCRSAASLPPCRSAVPCPRERCSNCGLLKITFEFDVAQMPLGMEPCETVCIRCAPVMRDIVQFRGGGGGGPDGFTPATAPPPPPPPPTTSAPYVLPQVPAPTPRGGRGSRGGSGAGRGGRGRATAAASVPCPTPHCASAGAMLRPKTVRKEGPTKGRSFVKCDACGYFAFVDAPGTTAA